MASRAWRAWCRRPLSKILDPQFASRPDLPQPLFISPSASLLDAARRVASAAVRGGRASSTKSRGGGFWEGGCLPLKVRCCGDGCCWRGGLAGCWRGGLSSKRKFCARPSPIVSLIIALYASSFSRKSSNSKEPGEFDREALDRAGDGGLSLSGASRTSSSRGYGSRGGPEPCILLCVVSASCRGFCFCSVASASVRPAAFWAAPGLAGFTTLAAAGFGGQPSHGFVARARAANGVRASSGGPRVSLAYGGCELPLG